MDEKYSFPGSAWERTVREAPPRRIASKVHYPKSWIRMQRISPEGMTVKLVPKGWP
jgi:hypothetical protein